MPRRGARRMLLVGTANAARRSCITATSMCRRIITKMGVAWCIYPPERTEAGTEQQRQPSHMQWKQWQTAIRCASPTRRCPIRTFYLCEFLQRCICLSVCDVRMTQAPTWVCSRQSTYPARSAGKTILRCPHFCVVHASRICEAQHHNKKHWTCENNMSDKTIP